MDFAALLPKIGVYIEVIAQVMLGLIVSATALAMVINKGKYQEDVNTFSGKMQKALGHLPTIGMNPRTKHLEAQIKEMKDAQVVKKDEPKS